MVKDRSVREETCCHIGYSFKLAARVLLYASSHRQDNTYHGLGYTSLAALVGTRINTHNCESKVYDYQYEEKSNYKTG